MQKILAVVGCLALVIVCATVAFIGATAISNRSNVPIQPIPKSTGDSAKEGLYEFILSNNEIIFNDESITETRFRQLVNEAVTKKSRIRFRHEGRVYKEQSDKLRLFLDSIGADYEGLK